MAGKEKVADTPEEQEIAKNALHIDELRTRLGQAAQMLGFYRGTLGVNYRDSAIALLAGIEKELSQI